jgi:hypothetical protein
MACSVGYIFQGENQALYLLICVHGVNSPSKTPGLYRESSGNSFELMELHKSWVAVT